MAKLDDLIQQKQQRDEDWKSRKLKKKPKEQTAYSPKAALAREGTI